MMRSLVTCWLFAALFTSQLASAQIYVDQGAAVFGAGTQSAPFLTINEAILNAHDGATIEVSPGTYNEVIGYSSLQLTLVASGGPTVTTIDGSGHSGPVVTMMHPGPWYAAPSVLRGFTVTGASASAPGILARLDPIHGTQAIVAIRDCIVSGNGVGIANDGADLMVQNSLVENNQGYGIGPDPTATAPLGSFITIQGSHVRHNGGEGIRVHSTAFDLNVYSSQVIGNTLSGVHVEGGIGSNLIADLKWSSFSNNGVDGVFAGRADLVDCVVDANGRHGVRAEVASTSLSLMSIGIIETQVTNNAAWGVSLLGGGLALSRSTVQGNQQGGVYVGSAFTGLTTLVEDTRIVGNHGDGLRTESSYIVCKGSLISGNWGTGVDIGLAGQSQATTLVNGCTLIGNAVGIAFTGSTSPNVVNTLVYHQTLADFDLHGFGGTLDLRNSCVESLPLMASIITSAVIDADPQLASGDWHLLPGSPCIDAGDSNFASGSDLDGDPRLLGLAADIGADEFACATTALCLSTTAPQQGAPLLILLDGPAPAAPAVLLADLVLGNTQLGALGNSQLAFSADLFALADATGLLGPGIVAPFTDAQGRLLLLIDIPVDPVLNGLDVHLEGYVLDPLAPNGVFRKSNLKSLTF